MAEVRIQSNSEFVQTKLEFQFGPDEIRILSWTEMIMDEIRIPISTRRNWNLFLINRKKIKS
jgi:hypothetical protein